MIRKREVMPDPERQVYYPARGMWITYENARGQVIGYEWVAGSRIVQYVSLF